MLRSLSLGIVAVAALSLAGCNSYRIAIPFTSNDDNDNQYYDRSPRRLPAGNRDYITPHSFADPTPSAPTPPLKAPETPEVISVPPAPLKKSRPHKTEHVKEVLHDGPKKQVVADADEKTTSAEHAHEQKATHKHEHRAEVADAHQDKHIPESKVVDKADDKADDKGEDKTDDKTESKAGHQHKPVHQNTARPAKISREASAMRKDSPALDADPDLAILHQGLIPSTPSAGK